MAQVFKNFLRWKRSAAATGGGALAVDNTVDAPAEVTTIIAAGAEIDGDEATLRGKDFYAQDTDPGAVGTGSVWKDTTTAPYLWWQRNVANTAWDPYAYFRVVGAVDEDAQASVKAEASGIGNAVATSIAEAADGYADVQSNATALGDGAAYAMPIATAGGSGNADVRASATATTGDAFAGSMAIRAGVKAGMDAVVDVTEARLGFNGTTPIAKPIVPLTAPDVQQVIDALVAYGLIVQSD